MGRDIPLEALEARQVAGIGLVGIIQSLLGSARAPSRRSRLKSNDKMYSLGNVCIGDAPFRPFASILGLASACHDMYALFHTRESR